MRKIWMLVTVSCLSWGRAAVADDVYVDLSVLDALDAAPAGVDAPFFPVFDESVLRPLPKPVTGGKSRTTEQTPDKAADRPEKAPVAAEKKAGPAVKPVVPVPGRKPNIRPLPAGSETAAKTVVSEKKKTTENKAKAVEKPAASAAGSEPAGSKAAEVKKAVTGQPAAPAVEKTTAAEKEVPQVKPAAAETPAAKPVVERENRPAAPVQPAKDGVSAAPKPAAKAAAAKTAKAGETVKTEDAEQTAKTEPAQKIPAAKAQMPVAESGREETKPVAAEAKPAAEVLRADVPAVAEKVADKAGKAETAKVVLPAAGQKENPPVLQPLIPVAEEEPAADVITFAGGVSELSAENAAALAEIADGFKRPGDSKILIYAYNFNDGGNDFRNKRLSLNRAVEIRSYLMTRGYKNFGIKIVNTDNRGKQNTVEVFEQAD